MNAGVVAIVRTDCGVMEWSKREKLGGAEMVVLEKTKQNT